MHYYLAAAAAADVEIQNCGENDSRRGEGVIRIEAVFWWWQIAQADIAGTILQLS